MSEFVSNEAAVNLMVNSGFDEETPVGLTPAAWEFIGMSPKVPAATDADACVITDIGGTSVGSTFERITQPEKLPGYRNFIRASIALSDTVTFRYPLNTLAHSLDNYRSQLAYVRWWEGPFSMAPSIRVNNGAVSYDFGIKYVNAPSVSTLSSISSLSNREFERFVHSDRLVFTGDDKPEYFDFTFSSLNGRVAEIDITAFQWVMGAYEELPFTGDFSYMYHPRNTIVIYSGPVCPPGTRRLDEVDPEALDRSILAANQGAMTGEKKGAESHTHAIGENQGRTTTSNSKDGGNRWAKAFPPHTHTVNEAPNRPLTRPMNFCVKL